MKRGLWPWSLCWSKRLKKLRSIVCLGNRCAQLSFTHSAFLQPWIVSLIVHLLFKERGPGYVVAHKVAMKGSSSSKTPQKAGPKVLVPMFRKWVEKKVLHLFASASKLQLYPVLKPQLRCPCRFDELSNFAVHCLLRWGLSKSVRAHAQDRLHLAVTWQWNLSHGWNVTLSDSIDSHEWHSDLFANLTVCFPLLWTLQDTGATKTLKRVSMPIVDVYKQNVGLPSPDVCDWNRLT